MDGFSETYYYYLLAYYFISHKIQIIRTLVNTTIEINSVCKTN